MPKPQKPLLLLAAVTLAGCASSEPTRERTLAGVERAEQTTKSSTQSSADRPPVILNKVGVPATEIDQRLAEAAGSVVLEEVILDRALADLITRHNVTVTRRDVDAEQTLLLRSLQEDARLDAAQAQAMLESLRRSRGLGPARFDALLARNAQLRALVRPDVEITGADVDRALAIEFGPAYRARVIRTQTEREAAQARAAMTHTFREAPDLSRALEQLAEQQPKPMSAERIDLIAAYFAQWAVKVSTHETAPQGGLFTELSPADENLPSAVRQSLSTLKPGEISPVYVTRDGAWLVLVERPITRSGAPTAADRDRTRARLTARAERLAMDRLARELLATANITVHDPHLRWSWESRPQDVAAAR